MLKKIFIGFVFIAIILIGYNLYQLATTKSYSPADVAQYSRDSLDISITYSRPYKKGRLIFGQEEDGALVPWGEVWRTGANEATEIITSRDIYLQDSLLAAGTYSLYTIPGENEWTLAINTKTDYWGRTITGSPFENRFDVFRVKARVSSLQQEAEQFTINFTEADSSVLLNFIWDRTKVSYIISNQNN